MVVADLSDVTLITTLKLTVVSGSALQLVIQWEMKLLKILNLFNNYFNN